ncbi:sensor histidine kinase [Paenibacillus sp. CAA11]|uniref:sensor histidine kinase n=1 Tax=Paenibacillus sp. CAA11 TaxID=1532905 RepID=UPI000D337525|nr:HAMP domain-containing sensor histidine kinase [Paenibacillus sp. CAA11]AWB43509.1 sensor histidine kinase [Paenibacillus sp. CAA11]
MRIKLRFGFHFIIGLAAWLLSISATLIITSEVLLPLWGITEGNDHYDLYILLSFLVNIIFCSLLFSWYFAGPLWFMMSWISNLSEGIYQPPQIQHKVYNRKGKLRRRFRLYTEVISNIHSLSGTLAQAAIERGKLEEAKREWIAGISHDLKTPLTYITGYSALLLNEDYHWSSQEQHSFLSEIQSKGLHIESLINDLSLSLQIDNGSASLPLNRTRVELVRFTQELFADIANDPRAQTYDLAFQSEEENLYIEADQRLLYRALQNVMMNAILHNPPQTRVEVSLSREESNFIHVTVADNGGGIEPETLSKLFNKYTYGTSSSAAPRGSGLGLSIVQSLIQAHGGLIDVESKPSIGTAFHIRLPAL